LIISKEIHLATHAVLYAYGISSAQKFVQRLGLKNYTPGSVVETLTVDELNEDEVSVVAVVFIFVF
jgi:hypothetical protein